MNLDQAISWVLVHRNEGRSENLVLLSATDVSVLSWVPARSRRTQRKQTTTTRFLQRGGRD